MDDVSLSSLADSTASINTSFSMEKKKYKKEYITVVQKELIINFIIENPEMVTHSSTKENEKVLWEEMTSKLNSLKPAKSLDNWKGFLNRWRQSIFSKPESSLKLHDCKLKNFLTKIFTNDNNDDGKEINMKNIDAVHKSTTIEEIINRIKDVEKEKSKLNLEVDDNDFRIIKYNSSIKSLECENVLKRKRIQQLNNMKIYLNQKRKRMEEKKENTEECQEN